MHTYRLFFNKTLPTVEGVKEMNYEDILQKLTNLPTSHFRTIYSRHYQEYSLQWVLTPTSLFHSSFRAHIWTSLRIGHCGRDCMLRLYSHYREAHLCIESTFESTLISHTRPELWSLLVFFPRSCDIISDLNDVLIVSIRKECDSSVTHELNRILPCTWCIV